MDAESNRRSGESQKNERKPVSGPVDGFVNVNDIVERRRRLRNAEFNNADPSWDADLNVQYCKNDQQTDKENI